MPTLKQTQRLNGSVTTTSPQEMAVSSQPHRPIPLSLSSAEIEATLFAMFRSSKWETFTIENQLICQTVVIVTAEIEATLFAMFSSSKWETFTIKNQLICQTVV